MRILFISRISKKKEKEKEENIWKRGICLFEEEKKTEEGKEGQGDIMC